jgi:hypothetical protein
MLLCHQNCPRGRSRLEELTRERSRRFAHLQASNPGNRGGIWRELPRNLAPIEQYLASAWSASFLRHTSVTP